MKRNGALGLASVVLLGGCSISTQDLGSLAGVPSTLPPLKVEQYLSGREKDAEEATLKYASLAQELRSYKESPEGIYSASILPDPLSSDLSTLTLEDTWPAGRKFGEHIELYVDLPGTGKQHRVFTNRDAADGRRFANAMVNILRQANASETNPRYFQLKNKDMFGDYTLFTLTPSEMGSPNISFSSVEYYGWGNGIPTERSNRNISIEYKEGVRASQTGISFSEGIQQGLRFATGAAITELINLGDFTSRRIMNRTKNPVTSSIVAPPLTISREDPAIALWHQFASSQTGQPEKIIIHLDEINDRPRLVIASCPRKGGAFYFEKSAVPGNHTLTLRDREHTEAIEWPFLGDLEKTKRNLDRKP